MKQTLFLPFVSLLAASFAFLIPILTPLAALGDRFLTFGLNFLDGIMPFAAVAGDFSHQMRPTRDVTYLTTGLHRLAQPVLMRQGDDPDNEEDDDDQIDNGLFGGVTGGRMNC